jgi:hypothetical protein
VLFDIDKKGPMVLLHGFIKKTHKTPEEELELASNNKNKHQRALQVKGMKMKRRRNHKVTNHDGSTFDGFLGTGNPRGSRGCRHQESAGLATGTSHAGTAENQTVDGKAASHR